MKDIITELAAWGCDIPSAMERLGGDKGLYVDCLKLFAKDENFANLEKTLQAKDYEEAFNCAHGLKGVAANLSLGPLLNSITTVSDALKHNEPDVAEKNYPELVANKKKYDEIVADD